jgi:endonuclease-3
MSATTAVARPRRKPARRRRRDLQAEARAWARRLGRARPGLVPFVLDGLAEAYGRPERLRRLDPTSELVLTILTQNTADVNAEQAFQALRARYPGGGPVLDHNPGSGWGGKGLPPGAAPDWTAVETAPLPELIDVIRPGGLGPQKAPRIQAALRTIRETSGDHSLDFLADMPALEARDWLTRIGGIGVKTASVLLLFSFGTPLMPVDRHVERVSHRVGLVPPKATANDAHDLYLALLEPDQMYDAHVLLIRHGRVTCHARRPACDVCPIRARCRYVDRKAP